MEAIAALSLACNVLQVTQTSVEIARLLKEVYKKGGTALNNFHVTHGAHMKAAVGTLQTSISSYQASSNTPLDHGDTQLLGIAQKLGDLANQLQERIASIPQSNKKRDLFKVFSKTLMTRGSIEEINQQLQAVQHDLNTRILVNLSLKINAVGIDTHNTANLGPELKEFVHILALKQSQEQASTRHEIESRTAVILADVSAGREEANKQRNTALRQEMHERLLVSLAYSEANSRQNQISVPHTDTFEWVFDNGFDADSSTSDEDEITIHNSPPFLPDERSNVQWDDLQNWLSNPGEIYWVNGKAGSGKSTFMKFLANDPRTTRALRRWAGQRALVIVQHYFWSSGSGQQRSSKGLFLSVLRQILQQCSRKIHEDTLTLTYSSSAHKRTPDDWSQAELIQLIDKIKKDTDLRICLFVDGLDENEASLYVHEQNVVEYLVNMSSQSNVKCCVSSRPLKLYQQQFKDSPSLRLQELTHPDVKKLVLDSLRKFDRSRTPCLDADELESLQRQITSRADGVFMWVSLALRSLEQGFLNDDPPETLSQRLNQLPRRLQELYEHMWRQLNGDEELYREEAALFFRLVLHKDGFWSHHAFPSSLICFMFAANDDHRKDLMESVSVFDESELVSKCKSIVSRVQTRCAGIIEFTTVTSPREEEDMDGITEASSAYFASQVQFIHRSAYTFLQETAFGKSILCGCPYSETDFAVKMIESVLSWLVKAPLKGTETQSFRERMVMFHLPRILDLLHPTYNLATTLDDYNGLYRAINAGLQLYKNSNGHQHDPRDPVYLLYMQAEPGERSHTVSFDGQICQLRSEAVFKNVLSLLDNRINPDFIDYVLLCTMDLNTGGYSGSFQRQEITLGALKFLLDLKPNVNRTYFLRHVFPFKKSATLLMLETSVGYLSDALQDWYPDHMFDDVSSLLEVFLLRAAKLHLDLSEKFVISWHPSSSPRLFWPIESVVSDYDAMSDFHVVLEVNLYYLVRLLCDFRSLNPLDKDLDLALLRLVEETNLLPQCDVILIADNSRFKGHRYWMLDDCLHMDRVSSWPWKSPTPEDAAVLLDFYEKTYVERYVTDYPDSVRTGRTHSGTDDDAHGSVSAGLSGRGWREQITDFCKACHARGQPAQFFDTLEARGYFRRFDHPDVMHIAPSRFVEDEAKEQ